MCLLSTLIGVEFDISLGSTYNFSSDITIDSQIPDGQNFKFSSKPSTYGFKSPQYYSLRFRFQKKELELIHHKLYFEDSLPGEVSHFEITDGYNMLMINILSPINRDKSPDIFSFRFGLGMVIAHPDVTVNDNRFYQTGGGLIPTVWTDGYQVSGLCSQLGFNINKFFNNNFSLNAETKISYARASINLGEQYKLNVPNLAIHFLMGISFGK